MVMIESPTPDGPTAVDVNDADFERVVVEQSRTRPVVVDLWAEWCGPCKTLSPILEKVAAERAGAFLLAKLDVDANPQTAGLFGVQSIPTVVAFVDGQPLNGFVGAYPEPAVNEFIDSILPSDAEVEAGAGLEKERSGDLATAEADYRKALEDDPKNVVAGVGLARILLERDDDEGARTFIQPLLPDPDAERVMATIRVRGWGAEPGDGTLGLAKAAAAATDWRGALEGFLHALGGDDRDAARAAMVDVFGVLGDDDPLTVEYRRKLTNALF